MKKAMKMGFAVGIGGGNACLSECLWKCAWKIKINGKDIQIPCTLDDIGEEYEYTLDYPFRETQTARGYSRWRLRRTAV